MLHGILGSGTNLRSLARRLTLAHPSWGFVLVDLRNHGLSQGAPPPHTVASAAADLLALGDHLKLPIDGVLGHSFGGKVALAYLEQRRGELDLAVILDASPSARPQGERSESTVAVLSMLRSIPQPLPSRARFLELVAERGFSSSIAEWLAMNLRLTDSGLRLRLDLDAIESLLLDYFAQDFWHVLEQPGYAREIHVIIGGRSDVVDAADRARLATLPSVHTHVLEEAGHSVHIDAPDAVFSVVSEALGPTRT
jgi:esterase